MGIGFEQSERVELPWLSPLVGGDAVLQCVPFFEEAGRERDVLDEPFKGDCGPAPIGARHNSTRCPLSSRPKLRAELARRL